MMNDLNDLTGTVGGGSLPLSLSLCLCFLLHSSLSSSSSSFVCLFCLFSKQPPDSRKILKEIKRLEQGLFIATNMTELIRDTAFGHFLRFVSRGKLLKYAEEADPSLYLRYVDEKKSGNLADHGDTNPRDDGTEPETAGGDDRRSHSRETLDSKGDSDFEKVNEASGVKVDPEKGKDKHVISWWGDHDTE